MATRIVFDLGDKLRISPPLFPNAKLDVQPGDLTKFTPYGSGVYGYQNREGRNQFTSAPSQESSGGVIYFGNYVPKQDFEAFLRIMEIKSDLQDYAVFIAESKQPGKDGYITQMRIVSKFGLHFMFGALTNAEYKSFPKQKMTISNALWTFIEQERKRWGTSWMEDRGLHGKFGGDGNYACEELAFGFMMENEYHGIYRIWSRAWLVTK